MRNRLKERLQILNSESKCEEKKMKTVGRLVAILFLIAFIMAIVSMIIALNFTKDSWAIASSIILFFALILSCYLVCRTVFGLKATIQRESKLIELFELMSDVPEIENVVSKAIYDKEKGVLDCIDTLTEELNKATDDLQRFQIEERLEMMYRQLGINYRDIKNKKEGE